MKVVEVAKEFHSRLANRNERQGDGKHTAIEFRRRFLSELDNKEAWDSGATLVTLDFAGVRKIGPSFANEAFGYFTKYTTPQSFMKKVRFSNISEVQLLIIEQELKSGYAGR